MGYDFKAARARIEQLRHLYRRMLHIQEQDGTWDWWIRKEIQQLESEIAAAQIKMTAGQGDHMKNIFDLIIPQKGA